MTYTGTAFVHSEFVVVKLWSAGSHQAVVVCIV